MYGEVLEGKNTDDDTLTKNSVVKRDEKLTNDFRSRFILILVNMAWFGLSTMFISLTIVVLPSQIKRITTPSTKGSALGIFIATASVFTLILSPLIGVLSDSYRSRFGRRKPFMASGMAILFFCLLMMTFTTPQLVIEREAETCNPDLEYKRCTYYTKRYDPSNIGAKKDFISDKYDNPAKTFGFMASYLMVVIGHTLIAVPYNGLLADITPESCRGFASGVMGSMTLLGNMTGASLGLLISYFGSSGLYLCLAIINLVCISITLVIAPKEDNVNVGVHQEINCTTVTLSYWEPLKEINFRWVFITRLLIQLGVSTVLSFMQFWLSDMVVLPYCWSSEKAVSVLLIPLLVSSALFAIIGGTLSDRLKKRKALIMGSSSLMFICMIVLAFLKGKYAFIGAIALAFSIGVGFGSFSAIDFAIVVDVLSNEKTKARDLAVWHQALVLPQCIASPVGGLILDIFHNLDCKSGTGYTILFLITAAYFLFGGLLVVKIKSVN